MLYVRVRQTVGVQNTRMAKVSVTSSRRRRQGGQAIVEFGIVILPLLAFLFLIMDVAWIIFGWACIQEGVREGVRFAVTGQLLPGCTGQDASIRQIVQQLSFGFAGTTNQCGPGAPANPLITIQYFSPTNMAPCNGANCNVGGNVVKITVSGVTIGSFGPIFRKWTPINLGASSSDVMEGSPNGTPPPR